MGKSSSGDRSNNSGVGGSSNVASVSSGSGSQTPDRAVSSGGGGVDDNRRNYTYHNLVKKLKKEIGDKSNASIKFLRQLLPLPKVMREVIVTEAFGTINDGKGNKVKGFNSDKKQGLQVSEKQKVSPWDILEGHKNPAPLSWTWFGAVKYERKPSRLEESFMELKYANFSNLEKPNSYFLEAPPLPPEDLEPPLSKRGEDSKVNEGDNLEAGIPKSNSQMQLMQSGQGSHEVQGVNSNTGLQSASNVSSPRSMMAIGRGRGTMIHGGGNMPVGAMQGMGRGGNLIAQRGKFGKKGKTRNIPTQGGPVGKGKGIPGVPGGNTQSGMISSQGGKPSMGMFSQGGNSIPPNASGSGSMSGNMIGPGQQWGSNNMMGGMQNSASGNSQFGSSNAGTTANSSG